RDLTYAGPYDGSPQDGPLRSAASAPDHRIAAAHHRIPAPASLPWGCRTGEAIRGSPSERRAMEAGPRHVPIRSGSVAWLFPTPTGVDDVAAVTAALADADNQLARIAESLP